MKTLKTISLSLLVGLFLMQSASVFAQDPVKVCPNVYKKVVLDNKRVRVIQIEFAPGETAVWHKHPDHAVYALTDGKLEITDKGKKPMVADFKEGMAFYFPAVTHMAKNIGTNTVKLVVTEIKPAGAKKMKDTPAGKK